MSREQYQPPSLTQSGSNNNTTGAAGGGSGSGGSTANATGSATFNITGNNTFEDSRPVHYLCGDCDTEVVLRKSEAIRCKECGYRVLYKQRTNR